MQHPRQRHSVRNVHDLFHDAAYRTFEEDEMKLARILVHDLETGETFETELDPDFTYEIECVDGEWVGVKRRKKVQND